MSKRTISSRRWLLLPMEIKVREFEPKVLLACIAAERGFGVLLGRNGFNTTGSYPQGVYLDKCISPNKLANFQLQVDGLGNKLASLDVEGLVYQTEEKWLRVRVSQETIDLSSLIFMWGDEQYGMINGAYAVPEKLKVTGSTTADLWQKRMHFLYQNRADDITNRFGEFLLLPSNFSTVINANGPDFIVKQFVKNKFVKNEEELNLLHESLAFHKRVFDKFVEMIPAVAENNPGLTVVLRPHPGDDRDVWQKLSKKWPENVTVLYEGNISPWILASRVLVHNSCSTAVEAFAMGKPAIAYMPHEDVRFDQNIPNPLSQQARSIDGVLQLIEANLRQDGLGHDSQKTALFNHFIKNKDDEFAGERIVNALEGLELPKSEFTFTRHGTLQKMRIVARKARRRFRDFRGQNEFSYAYRMQKNPGVSLEEVNNLLDLYRKNLGMWQDIQVEQVEEDAFCFYKES